MNSTSTWAGLLCRMPWEVPQALPQHEEKQQASPAQPAEAKACRIQDLSSFISFSPASASISICPELQAWISLERFSTLSQTMASSSLVLVFLSYDQPQIWCDGSGSYVLLYLFVPWPIFLQNLPHCLRAICLGLQIWRSVWHLPESIDALR